MKIIFLQKSTKYSGAENIVLQLMSLLPPEYETYYVSPNGPIKKVVEESGLNFVALGKPNLLNVKKVIKQLHPDIIHANDFTMSVLAAFASGKIPVISHLHNDPSWIKNPLDIKSILYALTLPFIKKVITVSNSIEKEYAYSFLMKQKNVIINNIVNIHRIIKKSKSSELNTIDNFDLVLIGRLTEQKNPIFFCKIVKEIKIKYPNIKAVIIGEGELKEKIQLFIRQNSLSNNIKLLGFKKNPYPYIRKSKIGVMPSIYEGFGLVAVEMLGLGKPVVCSNVGGLQNIVTDECGRVCTSFKDYIDEIEKLLSDSKYYNMKAMYAVKRSKKYADINNFKNNFLKVYKEVNAE